MQQQFGGFQFQQQPPQQPVNRLTPLKQHQCEGEAGIQIEINTKGVYVLWSNGTINWYDFELTLLHQYHINSVNFCLTQNPNILLTVDRVGIVSMINTETH